MIYILTGPVGSGKTTFLKKVIEELKRQAFKLDGYLSEAIMQDREKIGYDLLDLGSGKSVPFIRRSGGEDWPRIGLYFFTPEGLSWAKKIILQSREEEILVVDEIGPLELSGEGVWPVLEKVVFQRSHKFLLVLRRNILEDFLKMVGNIKTKIYELGEENLWPRLIEEIKKPQP